MGLGTGVVLVCVHVLGFVFGVEASFCEVMVVGVVQGVSVVGVFQEVRGTLGLRKSVFLGHLDNHCMVPGFHFVLAGLDCPSHFILPLQGFIQIFPLHCSLIHFKFKQSILKLVVFIQKV